MRSIIHLLLGLRLVGRGGMRDGHGAAGRGFLGWMVTAGTGREGHRDRLLGLGGWLIG